MSVQSDSSDRALCLAYFFMIEDDHIRRLRLLQLIAAVVGMEELRFNHVETLFSGKIVEIFSEQHDMECVFHDRPGCDDWIPYLGGTTE